MAGQRGSNAHTYMRVYIISTCASYVGHKISFPHLHTLTPSCVGLIPSHSHNYVYGGKSLEHVERSQCDGHERICGNIWWLIALEDFRNQLLFLYLRQLVCLIWFMAVKAERVQRVTPIRGGMLWGCESEWNTVYIHVLVHTCVERRKCLAGSGRTDRKSWSESYVLDYPAAALKA